MRVSLFLFPYFAISYCFLRKVNLAEENEDTSDQPTDKSNDKAKEKDVIKSTKIPDVFKIIKLESSIFHWANKVVRTEKNL